MFRRVLVLSLLPVLAVACPEPPAEIDPGTPVAFFNVHVVSMTGPEVLFNQVVVVEDGKVAALGEIPVPENAFTIDASGCYLMPGLADMHFHMNQGNRHAANDLFLFLAKGVTTARLMWGGSDALRLRELLASGAIPGPRLIVASPGMDGPGGNYSSLQPPMATPAQARTAVAAYRQAGYDYIKVYTSLGLDVYRAIVDEARRLEIKVVGHVPTPVGLGEVLAARQYSIEHMMGMEAAVYNGTVRETAEAVRDSGAWSVPTLRVMHTTRDQIPELEARPEMRYVSPNLRAWFRDPLTYGSATRSERRLAANRESVIALREVGARLMLGTDCGFRYLIPGFAIFDEMRMLAEAGLTPYQIMRMATADAAEHLERTGEFGTVEPGKAADLLLLEANPLDSVENVRLQVGVMRAGRWFSSAELQRRLEEIAFTYGN